MNRNVTLREVAQEAGVHVSTASRALNPETRSIVNDETAERVIAVADRLGYRPHPLARGLRTQRTLTIGMTVPDLANPIFPIIYSGAAKVLEDEGYTLHIESDSLTISEEDDAERIEEVNGVLRGHRVDGWILTDAQIRSVLPEVLLSQGVPAVLAIRTSDRIDAPSICVDDHIGIGLVVRHLVDLGHTAIAHVAGPKSVSGAIRRREAFVHWMGEAGIEAPDSSIVHADAFLTPDGRRACEALLDSGQDFTAIIAANDLIALGCYDALEARGIDVPGSMSVTGYDDMAFIDRVNPPMTTVSVPFYELGASSGKVMLSLLAAGAESDPGVHQSSVRLEPTLAIRASTAPPKTS